MAYCHQSTAAELSSVVKNLKPAKEIAVQYQVPVSYLATLKVSDPSADLDPLLCYDLARHLMDVHYLSQALNHQSYLLEANIPIIKLAITNFPGLKAHIREGGQIFSHVFVDYFKSNDMYCGQKR